MRLSDDILDRDGVPGLCASWLRAGFTWSSGQNSSPPGVIARVVSQGWPVGELPTRSRKFSLIELPMEVEGMENVAHSSYRAII
jgi:hypothetical protein